MLDEKRLNEIAVALTVATDAKAVAEELLADSRDTRKLLAETHALIKPLEWLDDGGRECAWCTATRHVFGPNRKARDNHRKDCKWLALFEATKSFAPPEPQRVNSRGLPEDRHDPEREWFFPGLRPGLTIGLDCDGTGRSMTWSKVGEKHRRSYDLMAGLGYIPDVWVGSAYPKDEWSEAEAHAHHKAHLAEFNKDDTTVLRGSS